MPKCLECGFEAPRLQWTHFRYKCSGRFMNGREYMAAYPNSKTVDDDVARSTAITLQKMISKYGEEEGRARWDSYRHKQAYTNTLESKQKRHGWTAEQFEEYNKSRAVTVDNLVNRYGTEIGIQKWNEYCERQRLTKSREYVIAHHGEDYWNDLCAAKKAPHDPMIVASTYGISYEQAVNKIISRHSLRYHSNIEREFIEAIQSKIGPLDHTSIHKPFGKWDHYNNRYVVYDIKHKDCIIEFNGDYWHANPKIYADDDLIRNKRASEIWQKDQCKIQIATDSGFRVRVVWEEDYLRNKTNVIEDVIRWMQDTPE